MYTYDYDFSFSPSMPVVDVALMPIARNREPVRMTAMIDSGADGTLVPLSQLRAIKAHRSGQVILRSVTGAPTVVDVYKVALQVGPHLFSYVRVAADKHNTLIVLGRDILNHLVITLNGLASATELLE